MSSGNGAATRETETSFDVVVVGGGIAGLEAAHYGTTFGTVFEKDGKSWSPTTNVSGIATGSSCYGGVAVDPLDGRLWLGVKGGVKAIDPEKLPWTAAGGKPAPTPVPTAAAPTAKAAPCPWKIC